MTRETRIGLLVGLGFIIMFGLVLAELTGANNKTTPPVAPETNSSLAWTPTIEQPRDAMPRPESATAGGDLRLGKAAPLPAVQPAPVAAGPAASPPVVQVDMKGPDMGPIEVAGAQVVPGVVASTVEKTIPIPPSLTAVDRSIAVDVPADLGKPGGAVEAPAPEKKYVVVQGDSLRKIAKKVYGPTNEQKYKMIIAANKSLKEATMLKIGQELVIPPLPEAKPADNRTADSRLAVAPAAPTAPGAPRTLNAEGLREYFTGSPTTRPSADAATADVAKPATPKRTYTIRSGDSLSKIAKRTLNDDSKAAINKIIEANKGRLSNPNRLNVGDTLVIPS